ncbi:MAG: histidinol-phosphatase [Parvibaculales bacterium]
MEDLATLMQFANRLADAAAAESLPLFRTATQVDNKLDAGFDPVTLADRRAEKAMRRLIEDVYPDHSILGEEFGAKQAGSWQWVLDPIDGTRAFITGLPIWGTLISLNHDGTPVLGVFDQPFTGERMTGAEGQPTHFWKDGHHLETATRDCSGLADAVIATTDPRFFVNAPGEIQMNRVLETAKLMRYGGDCYNYAMLACGQLDAVIEQGLQAYDIQALIPIIEGAGGKITDWQGGSAASGGQVLACGSAGLHAELLELFGAAAA